MVGWRPPPNLAVGEHSGLNLAQGEQQRFVLSQICCGLFANRQICAETRVGSFVHSFVGFFPGGPKTLGRQLRPSSGPLVSTTQFLGQPLQFRQVGAGGDVDSQGDCQFDHFFHHAGHEFGGRFQFLGR